jgi:prefoldin alpha subunit
VNDEEARQREYELASMQYALQAYQDRYNAVLRDTARLVQEMRALQDVETALNRADELSGKEALVDSGMGFFVGAETRKLDKVAVAIGAGIIAEKSVEEAKQIARERIAKRDGELKKLFGERKELESAVYELSYKIQETVG